MHSSIRALIGVAAGAVVGVCFYCLASLSVSSRHEWVLFAIFPSAFIVTSAVAIASHVVLSKRYSNSTATVPITRGTVMPTSARLRWWWRGALGAIAGAACLGLEVMFERTIEPIVRFIDRWLWIGGLSQEALGVAIVFGLPTALVAISVYGLMTRCLGAHESFDGETHCRKCGYILRGITEPRCSECGERI